MKKRSIYIATIACTTIFLAACNSETEEVSVIQDTGNTEQHTITTSDKEKTVQDTPTKSENEDTVNITGKESIKKKLTPYQKYILYESGTEPAFHNAYWDFHGTGIYVDIVDGTPLFSSLDKFNSGTGRPSFTKPITKTAVTENKDTSLGITRTEVISTSSKGHLGHVFDDGPPELGGLRYCINSAALRFVPIEEMKAQLYEKYMVLFK